MNIPYLMSDDNTVLYQYSAGQVFGVLFTGV